MFDGLDDLVRVRHYDNRLIDTILAAFHQACDQKRTQAAEQLLAVAMVAVRNFSTDRPPDRRQDESVTAAHLRLCALRQSDGGTDPA